MFEITDQQRNLLCNFLNGPRPLSTSVFFDETRITFSATMILVDGKREEEITIYANGQTKIEKSESINSGANTTKPIEKNEFY